MDNVREQNPDSIVREYSVTDKADGLANILFKVGVNHLSDDVEKQKYSYLENYIFLIDTNLKIYNTEMKLNDNIGTCIFNGEYLNYDKNKNLINKYGIYDTYIYNDIDTCELPLISRDNSVSTRNKIGTDYISKLTNEISIINNPLDLDIFHKEFYVPDGNNTILDCTKIIWNNFKTGKTEYKLDGTIYTPINDPVGYNSDKIDYYLNQGVTWFRNLKWKPSEENTIDFLVRFEKEAVSKFKGQTIYKNKTKTIKSDTGSYDEYIIGNLYNTGSEKVAYNSCDNKKFNIGKIKPIPFRPPKPKIDNINFGLFKLKHISNTQIIIDHDDNPVRDDTIVEVNYTNFDPTNKDLYEPNKNKRFSILRTRYDKTYTHRIAISKQKELFKIIKKCISIAKSNSQVRKAVDFVYKNRYLFSKNEMCGNLHRIQRDDIIRIINNNKDKINEYYKDYSDVTTGVNLNYGNSVDVANNIWMSIYNPVTEQIITGEDPIPEIAEEEKKYYNRQNNRKRDKSITIGLQNFHNKIIKKRILLENVSKALKIRGKTNISLLDLSCGKGGDIAKWRDCGITHCVGIDISPNNINDPIDGACERYNFYKKKNLNNLPNIEFLVGDSSKNLANESFTVRKYKDMYDKLWNSEEGPNYSKNKFDIISLMFSLHYFFKDKNSIDNLINNIATNIANEGYLVGACFDGDKIFSFLEDLNMNEEKGAFKDGKLIWKIIKKYSKPEFENSDNSLGMAIKVYMYTIGQYIEEYLVNFNYFKDKLQEHNIEILQPSDSDTNLMMLPKIKGVKTSIGSFEDIFNSLNKFSQNANYVAQFNLNKSLHTDILNSLSDAEKNISFFSKYFIFKKRSGQSLEKTIKLHILQNKDKRGYITNFKNMKWDKLRKKVFKELELSETNVEEINAYNRATTSISNQIKAVSIKSTASKSSLKTTKSLGKKKLKIKGSSSKKIIISTSKKKSKTKDNTKLIEYQNKIEKVVNLVEQKIKIKDTAGLTQSIDSLLKIFDIEPYNKDSQISQGIEKLNNLKKQI